MDVIEKGSEEWFLEAVESEQMPADELVKHVRDLFAHGHIADGESRGDMLQQALAEREMSDKALQVMVMRMKHAPAGSDLKGWRQQALKLIGADWERKTLLEQAGFEEGLPVPECGRRLELLLQLHEGTVVLDKTWGLGIVGSTDYFYKKVDIRFERKPNHQLSLAYAAETLEILSEDHLLSWKHHRPEELREKIEKEPGQVVKMAIRSFGPLPTPVLQERLSPDVIPEKDWKKFWDGARKALKKDPSVIFPSNRKDPVQLLEGDTSQDDYLFDQIGNERNMELLADLFEQALEESAGKEQDEHRRGILRDRLAFVVKGAWPKHPELIIRCKLAARDMGADSEEDESLKAIDRYFDPDTFMLTLKRLPVRLAQPFLTRLQEHDAERLVQLLHELMPAMDITSLNESVTFVTRTAGEDVVAARFRDIFETRAPNVEVLSWVARNMEKIEEWRLAPFSLAVQFMLDELDKEYAGDQLRAQNQIRERFERMDWVKPVMDRFDAEKRRNFILRIRNSGAWAHLDKQSLLARIVKAYPEMERVLADRKGQKEEVKPKGKLTSNRSYEERRRQLKNIVEIEIPKVAKDIARAREYGDLRENFEFKAAKDAQALLFRRRDEITDALAEVTPTDFRGARTDIVGQGTTVSIRYADGREERFHILGEWDGDVDRGILSSNSRMAQSLIGAGSGDSLTVPTETGEETVTIAGIQPLPDDIRNWIEQTDIG